VVKSESKITSNGNGNGNGNSNSNSNSNGNSNGNSNSNSALIRPLSLFRKREKGSRDPCNGSNEQRREIHGSAGKAAEKRQRTRSSSASCELSHLQSQAA
jgi:hypothetical protein